VINLGTYKLAEPFHEQLAGPQLNRTWHSSEQLSGMQHCTGSRRMSWARTRSDEAGARKQEIYGSQPAPWPAWPRHALMHGGMPAEEVLAGGTLELEEPLLRVAAGEDVDEAVITAELVAVLEVAGSL